jgi:superfamily II DNA or RNA helicase
MKTRDEIRTSVQDEALAKVLPLNRAGIGASMGVGKTLIGLRHMAANYTDYCKFLVVGPKKVVMKVWQDEAVKHGLEYLIPHFDYTTYISLPKQSNDYDVVYLDECHSLLLSHKAWLTDFRGKILGLTGTPPRFERSEKGQMVEEFCPIVYEYETDEAIGDDILNDYRIFVHTLPMDDKKTMQVNKNGKTWYTSELASYTYWTNRLENARNKKEQQIMSVMRMKAMMEFPSKEGLGFKLFNLIQDKCLLFANTMAQADRLCKNSYHSDNPNSEEALQAFKRGDIMKLSCVLQLNEGVNIPDLKQGIILHAYGNERKSSQRIGRLLRLNPEETATVHILCYKDSVDEKWVKSALEKFDQTKITWQHNG